MVHMPNFEAHSKMPWPLIMEEDFEASFKSYREHSDKIRSGTNLKAIKLSTAKKEVLNKVLPKYLKSNMRSHEPKFPDFRHPNVVLSTCWLQKTILHKKIPLSTSTKQTKKKTQVVVETAVIEEGEALEEAKGAKETKNEQKRRAESFTYRLITPSLRRWLRLLGRASNLELVGPTMADYCSVDQNNRLCFRLIDDDDIEGATAPLFFCLCGKCKQGEPAPLQKPSSAGSGDLHEFKEVFDAFDLSATGAVRTDAVTPMLVALDIQKDTQLIMAFIKDVDYRRDRSGTFDYDEFLNLCATLLNKYQNQEMTEESLRQKALETSKSVNINLDTLRGALATMGVFCSVDELKKWGFAGTRTQAIPLKDLLAVDGVLQEARFFSLAASCARRTKDLGERRVKERVAILRVRPSDQRGALPQSRPGVMEEYRRVAQEDRKAIDP